MTSERDSKHVGAPRNLFTALALVVCAVTLLSRPVSSAGPMSFEDPLAFCKTFAGTVSMPMWGGKPRPIELRIDQPAATSGAWRMPADMLAKIQKSPGQRFLLRSHIVEEVQVKTFKDHLARFSGNIDIPFFDALGITNGLPSLLSAGLKVLPALTSLTIKQLGKKQAAVASEIAVVMEKGAMFEEWAILSNQTTPRVLAAISVYRVKVQNNDRRYSLCSTTAEVTLK